MRKTKVKPEVDEISRLSGLMNVGDTILLSIGYLKIAGEHQKATRENYLVEGFGNGFILFRHTKRHNELFYLLESYLKDGFARVLTTWDKDAVATIKNKVLTKRKQDAKTRKEIQKLLGTKYALNARARTIQTNFTTVSDFPLEDQKHIAQLINLGYNIQIALF